MSTNPRKTSFPKYLDLILKMIRAIEAHKLRLLSSKELQTPPKPLKQAGHRP